MQADDFLSILIYIIIKAGNHDIMPLLEIIANFTLNEKAKKSEYMKISIHAAT